MKDKQRLEMLENGSAFSSDDITFLLRQARLYQISRDDTREACHKLREENKKLKQKNECYREAINEAMECLEERFTTKGTAHMILEDATLVIEALESESE